MGKSQLIASMDNGDTFVGFAGPKIRQVMLTDGLKKTHRRTMSLTVAPKDLLKIVSRRPSEEAMRKNFKVGDLAPNNPDATASSPPPTPKQEVSRLGGCKMFIDTSVSTLSNNLNSSAKTPLDSASFLWTPLASNKTALNTGSERISQSQSMSPFNPWSHGMNSLTKQASLKVKCHYRGDTRLIVLPVHSCGFDVLFAKVAHKFKITSQESEIKLKYRDEDSEMMVLADDEDLEMAMCDLQSDISGNVKLEIHLTETA